MLTIEKIITERTRKECTSKGRNWHLEIRNWRYEEIENKRTGKYLSQSKYLLIL